MPTMTLTPGTSHTFVAGTQVTLVTIDGKVYQAPNGLPGGGTPQPSVSNGVRSVDLDNTGSPVTVQAGWIIDAGAHTIVFNY